MSIFQNSTTTFSQAKVQVAEATGKQQSLEFLQRAGRSIQYAFRAWNAYNWRWLVKDASDIVTVSGTSTYVLPYDFSDVYTLRVTSGTQRPIVLGSRSDYDHDVWEQTNDLPCRYNLTYRGTGGVIELMPTPKSAETIKLKYHRKLIVPCAVSYTGLVAASAINADGSWTLSGAVGTNAGATVGSYFVGAAPGSVTLYGTVTALASTASGDTVTVSSVSGSGNPASGSFNGTLGGDNFPLDIPAQYETGILAMATQHFISGIGGSDQKIMQWASIARETLTSAIEENEMVEDDEPGFKPPSSAWPYPPNPNTIYE